MATNPNENLSARAIAEQVVWVAGVPAQANAAAQQILVTQLPTPSALAVAESVLLVQGTKPQVQAVAEQWLLTTIVADLSVTWWTS